MTFPEFKNFEFESDARYILLENGKQIQLTDIDLIRHDGKVLNFSNVLVNVECVVDDRNYEAKEVSLQTVKTKESVYYTCSEILKASNRRKAFRTRASFDAVLTNRESHVVTEAVVYDMSTSGIGLLLPESYKIDVGAPVTVAIFINSGSKNIKPELLKLTGEVARVSEQEARSKVIVGIKLNERDKPGNYDKLVYEAQVKFRNGRNNVK